MRLVDDDEIEIVRQQALGMLAAARLRDRRDQALLAPECVGIVAQKRIMGGGASNVELGLQLFPPLPDQRRRRQHQHALHHAAQQVLLEHHAGLDGLAEADFVGEQHPAAELLEHLADGLDLIPEGFDSIEVGQAQKLVEALGEAEMGEAFAKPVPGAVAIRRTGGGLEKRREVERGRERDVDIDAREPHRLGRRVGSDGGSRNSRVCGRQSESLAGGFGGLHGRFRGCFGSRLQRRLGCRPARESGRRLTARFSENICKPLIEPFAPPPTARKRTQHVVGRDQAVAFEDCARHGGLVLLLRRQGGQQVMGGGWDAAL